MTTLNDEIQKVRKEREEEEQKRQAYIRDVIYNLKAILRREVAECRVNYPSASYTDIYINSIVYKRGGCVLDRIRGKDRWEGDMGMGSGEYLISFAEKYFSDDIIEEIIEEYKKENIYVDYGNGVLTFYWEEEKSVPQKVAPETDEETFYFYSVERFFKDLFVRNNDKE